MAQRLSDEYGIERHFGSSSAFCKFLKAMKAERNHQSHRAFQLRHSIAQLTPQVLLYCRDYEQVTLKELEQATEMEASERESRKAEAAEERSHYEQRSKQMMMLLEQLVGEYPFGRPGEQQTPA